MYFAPRGIADLAASEPAEQTRSEQQIVEAITTARANNVSWQRIGELLGTSAQAAQQRYASVIEAA